MTASSIELNDIRLSSTENNLQLTISSILDLHHPPCLLDHVNDIEKQALLASGVAWVHRGAGFSLALKVFLDGVALKSDFRGQVLETLGSYLKGSEVCPKATV